MNRKMILYLLGCFSAVAISSCREKNPYSPTVLDGFAQGSTFHIVVRDSVARDLARDVDSILAVVDRSASLYEPQSLLSRINRNETDSLDAILIECIRVSEELSRESGGRYDITVKPLTEAYGFAGGRQQDSVAVDSLLQLVGYRKISIDNGRLVKERPEIQIDLNAVAQGYTVDLIARHFDRLGYANYIVEVGGEIFSRGLNMSDEPWVVGIDKPFEGNYVPGRDVQVKIHLTERGLATSGNYRKFHTDAAGRKIVHTVDAVTGQPVVSNLLSATVVAPDATLADIYGTFFMIVGLDETIAFLEKREDLDAFLVYSDEKGDFQTYATPGLRIKE